MRVVRVVRDRLTVAWVPANFARLKDAPSIPCITSACSCSAGRPGTLADQHSCSRAVAFLDNGCSCHGGIWSSADPARSLGIGESTVRRYLDLFANLLVVRQLQPWHENLSKRQLKAPKVYVRDSGLLHTLLGIRSESELLAHPKSGASWEGYVLEEVLNAMQPDLAYFWATHQGAELDLLLLKDGRRVGVEIKRTDAPAMTPSMRIALHDLRLEQLVVFYPGTMTYELGPKARAVPIDALVSGSMKTVFPKRFITRPSTHRREVIHGILQAPLSHSNPDAHCRNV